MYNLGFRTKSIILDKKETIAMSNKDLKRKLYTIIFEADTYWGRFFDIVLLIAILISVIAVMLESVDNIYVRYGRALEKIELVVTLLFTVEYAVRIWIVEKKKKYIFSFYGIIDFLAILPFYLALLFNSPKTFIVIRTLRLLRLFKIMGLSKYQNESQRLINALKASKARIAVFLYAVLIIVAVVGALMYLVEGAENGFTSIPRSIYWAIVTITTVGYGDIAPQTTLGQFIAGFLMIVGYSIIAVPTGIVTAEMVKQKRDKVLICHKCGHVETDLKAKYCKYCGEELIKPENIT